MSKNMSKQSKKTLVTYPDSKIHSDQYYKELERRYILRQVATWPAPLIILTIYFQYQYHSLTKESRMVHLKSNTDNDIYFYNISKKIFLHKTLRLFFYCINALICIQCRAMNIW